MSNWPLPMGGTWSGDVVQDESISEGVAVSGGGTETANVKRPWTEIFAAVSQDLAGLLIHSSPVSQNHHLMDVGIGAAASEVVIVPDVWVSSGKRNDDQGVSLYLPVAIPQGARVATRAQTTSSANPALVTVQGIAAGPFAPGFTQFEAIGVDLSSSQGTTLTADATANTEGAWTELKASTSYDLSAIMVLFGMDGVSLAAADNKVLLDLAIGAGGSEVVIYEGLSYTTDTFSDFWLPNATPWLPCSIPAGSRIAARIQSNTASQVCAVSLLGVGAG